MRVLIAEGDMALASFVRRGLEVEHYAVDGTHDGEQACAMAGELDYDLLMLDLNLPRVDGVTILTYLSPRKPSMPILILTRGNKVEDPVHCLETGSATLATGSLGFDGTGTFDDCHADRR